MDRAVRPRQVDEQAVAPADSDILSLVDQLTPKIKHDLSLTEGAFVEKDNFSQQFAAKTGAIKAGWRKI